jgi:ferrous iron transport protein A
MSAALDDASGVSLAQVRAGRRVTVVGLDGDATVCKRLEDLGFWPGVAVDVVRKAPLGDPTQYRLQGYRLALRRAEAACVRVREDGDQA